MAPERHGRAGGAWVVGFDEIERDPEQLRRIMWMLQDRCLVDWDAESPARILTRISGAVPGELLSALQRNILTTPELLAEISERRSSYAAAVEQHRARARSKVAPLAWPTEMPDQQELVTWAARAQSASASPVAAGALALTAVVASTAQLWQDTEQTWHRRTYSSTRDPARSRQDGRGHGSWRRRASHVPVAGAPDGHEP